MPLLESQIIKTEYNNEMNNNNTLENQIEPMNIDELEKMESNTVFVLVWALKENQKFDKRDPIKRITPQQMHANLLERVENNEIENNNNTLENQIEPMNIDELEKMESNTVFVLVWALKENQKFDKRDPIKRITPQVKKLLEMMFHSGTANPRQKCLHSKCMQIY
ncbi:hypothetical protein Glove_642g10 [Diversispora epigaea]|uniref:Uncharacterized protein n=1 Tax=Diversispora epigaea TaxID=1348612 RepID=A0A397G946_9GLOM|nr:hypothetical protein Glove_642g10 [Diversispora epigaea]